MNINSVLKITFSLLILGLTACSSKEREVETIEFEDFLPKSERDYNYEEVEEEEEEQQELHPIASIIKEMMGFELVQPEKGRHFPNRFSYKSHEDFLFVSATDTFHYSHWYYEDSLRTTSALFNWMDCFGKSCQSLRFDEDLTVKSPAYFSLWATDTALVFIHSDKRFNINQWKNAMEKVYFPEELPNYHFYQLRRNIVWWKEESGSY